MKLLSDGILWNQCTANMSDIFSHDVPLRLGQYSLVTSLIPL